MRPPIPELDRLPPPAYDLIDTERYRTAWIDAHGRFSWNMVTSRGCPYRCNWCAKPVFGSTYRQNSPARVAVEMKAIKNTIKADHIWFADDIFGLTTDWLEAFGKEVVRLDAAIPFMAQSRVNLMKKGAVTAMAAAGAEELWLGVESGSQRILDAMEKGSTIQQARDATATLRAAGIKVGWFVQLGYVGEEWDDLEATRDLIRAERPDSIGVSVSYPLPGTVFHENVKMQIGDKSNWDDSDDLAMMFAGTFRTEFYREIRTLLHDEVDAFGTPRDGHANFDARWNELAARAPENTSDPSAAAI